MTGSRSGPLTVALGAVVSAGYYLIALCLSIPSLALAWQDLVHELCPPHGVPVSLAMAIIDLESSGNPYALGVTMPARTGGYVHREYYPAHPVTAAILLDHALTQYTRNVGIGLMQITWSVHGDRLSIEPQALLAPRTNIEIGCELLGTHLREPGPMAQRIGRYHSRTPHLRDAYAAKVLARLKAQEPTANVVEVASRDTANR